MASTLTRAKIEEFIAAGTGAKSQTMFWDNMVVGLGLRLRPGGGASWVFVYRPKGAGRREPARRLTLGRWPTLALEAARTAARAKAGLVALGGDPAVEQRAERNRERRALAKALDEFENTIRRRHLVNARTILSTLKRGLAPFMRQEIDNLSRKDFVEQIEQLENANLPGAASDLRKHSRAFLEWAVGKGLVPFNVLAGLRRPRSSRAERLGEGKRQGKALSDTEIIALWKTADKLGSFGGLVQLALL
ncbi:MAG: integrase arm-type DNA-binding domain-containing protein, partial [Bradyrhizobium sp.]